MALTRTAETYITRATEAFNAGFNSKAGQQAALAALNTAYDYRREIARKWQLEAAPRTFEGFGYDPVRSDWFGAREVPFDHHNVRDKHLPIFIEAGVPAEHINELRELRAQIKAAPVNAPVRREPSKFEVQARETMMELIQRRGEQYLRAIDLAGIFNGLPVSANTHYCVNDHGTGYLRTFWYLAGEFTPLNVIIAAAEELERRAA